MATTVNSIVSKAAILLQDLAHVRWTPTEMADWISAGQLEVVTFKPDAGVTTTPMLLTPSTTKQTIPNSLQVMDVVRNMGVDGATPGRGISVASRDALNMQVPLWHSTANRVGYVEHFTYDPRSMNSFYVYPMAPATAWYVEVLHAAIPAACVVGGTINIPDVYANALLDYAMYRCLSKDATNAQNLAAAGAYYQLFTNTLVGKSKTEVVWNPNNLGTSPVNPDTPVVAVRGGA